MDNATFAVGTRVRIARDYSEPKLRNQVAKVVALPNKDNEYLVRVSGGEMEGQGVLIKGDCLHNLASDYGIKLQ
jgi:hypothetical protein